MSQPQRERKSFWERTSTIIGVVSAAIGLVVTIFGLPNALATALGRSTESRAAELELQDKRAELAAKGPRLDVSYVFLATNVNEGLPPVGATGDAARPKSREATTILSFPSVANEVASNASPDVPKACGLGRQPIVSLASLVVRNRGLRDAERIAVSADRLVLGRPVLIREAPSGGDDYVAKLESSAKRASTTIRIPLTLAPGDGVRVQLWMSASDSNRYDRWCVVSRAAFRPRAVRFRDPVLGTVKTVGVRRLDAPVVLANGLVGRG